MRASLAIYSVSALNLIYSFYSIRIISVEFGEVFLGHWLIAFTAAQYVLGATSSLSNVIHSKHSVSSRDANTSLLVAFCSSAFAFIVMVLFASYFHSSQFFLYLSLGYFFFGKAILSVYQAFFLMEASIVKAKLLELVFLVFSALHIMVVTVFEVTSQQFVFYLFIAASLHIGFLGVLYLRITMFAPRFRFSGLKSWFKNIGLGALRLFPSTLAATLIWNTDNLVIVSGGLGENLVEYNVLFRIFIAAASILTLLSPIVVNSLKRTPDQLSKYLIAWGVVNLAICAPLLFFLELPTRWLMNEKIAVNYTLAGAICAYSILFSLNSVCSASLLVKQSFSMLSKITMTEVLINVLLSATLSYYFGIVGVAVGSFTAALVSLMVMLNVAGR